MAGDWIPIRCKICDCPKIARIAEQLNLHQDEVVGKLIRMWAWFGEHTTDGRAQIGAKFIDDRVVMFSGFAAACCDKNVKYLSVDGETVCATEWEKWNARSAKTRLKERLKKQKQRQNKRPRLVPDLSPTCPGNVHSTVQYSTEEKRRESGGGAKSVSDTKLDAPPLAEDAAAAAVFSCLRSFGLDQEGIRRIAAMVPLPALETVEAWVNNIRKRSPQPTNPNGLLLAMLTDRIIPPNGVTPDQEKAIAQVRDTFARVKAKRAAEEARKRRTFI